MVDDEGQHGLRQQRDANKDENQRRLGEDRHHHRTAGADAAISAAGIEAGKRDHEGSECEDQPATEDIAHVR